jgi:nucleotide-binding universal stress UspA family protein
MKRILVPTDFSPNSQPAIHVAAAMALATGAEVELLHADVSLAYVSPLAEYALSNEFSAEKYAIDAAEEMATIKHELAQAPDYANLNITTRVESGDLYEVIQRIANEDEADLIIMGTRGASGAEEVFFGSNTEKIIRTAKCPVLSVPTSIELPIKWHTLVLPTTLLPDQYIVYGFLANLQRIFPFQVKLLYLNNPAQFAPDFDLEAHIQNTMQSIGLKNVSTYTSTSTNNEEAAILEFAQMHHADVIAMGTHQRKGVSHFMFGSITEDTANHAKIPVLSIPV